MGVPVAAEVKRQDIFRFLAFVSPEPMSGCWLWTGALNPDGYGKFKVRGKRIGAHRWAHERFRWPIPPGLEIDHLCRQRSCVNPDHLEVVTGRENTLRGNAPAAQLARRTHCMRGHPFDEANTYRTRKGERRCRICNRERLRARRRTRKGDAARKTAR